MQQSFLSARVGPILGLVGSSIVLIYYFSLPLDSLVSEWDGTPWQGSLDPVVVVVLLAALAVLILSVVALFLPHLPVLGSLGLYAASVGLLAQLYSFFYSFMEFGATLTNLPRLFSFLVSILFAGWWLLLLGFLLSGGAMALTAIKAEQQAGVTLHRDHQPAFPGTEQHANETPARERGGRQSIQEVDEKESVWSLDQRHILAMIVGVLLYSVLSNLSILWEGPGEANIVAVSPAVILVLFFGIVYGPWVGLVTGGIGSFLYNAISALVHAPSWTLSNWGMLNGVPLTTSHPRVYWPLVVGNAVVGLIAGLPLFGAAGRDKTVRSLLAVMMRSALAIVVGIFLRDVFYGIGLPVALTLLGIQGSFTSETIPTLLVVVLLLPLLLVLSPVKTTHRREV
jgi:energy-coupling factor transport system substrate-specific component